MKSFSLTLLLLALLPAGCDRPEPQKGAQPPPLGRAAAGSPAERSHRLILRYNQLLSDGYRTIDMTRLQEVATPELAQKAYHHMAAIGEGKSRMSSRLKKIEFVETDCSHTSSCRVVTRERWDFGYADIRTGAKLSEVEDYLYQVQYLMENRQGRWLLTEISASGEERQGLPSWNRMLGNK